LASLKLSHFQVFGGNNNGNGSNSARVDPIVVATTAAAAPGDGDDATTTTGSGGGGDEGSDRGGAEGVVGDAMTGNTSSSSSGWVAGDPLLEKVRSFLVQFSSGIVFLKFRRVFCV
jgi:hypothetical protein